MAKNQKQAPKRRKHVSRRQRFTNITIWVVLFTFIVGGVFFFTPGGLQIFDFSGGENTETVIQVNDTAITANELSFATSRAIAQFAQQLQQQQINVNQVLAGANGARERLRLRNQAKEQLIEETLIMSAADRRGIGAPNTELDPRVVQAYDSWFSQQGITEDQLREFLNESLENRQYFQQFLFDAGIANVSNGTISELRNAIRENQEMILKEEKLRDAVVNEVDPTDLEILDFVEERRNQFEQQIVGPYVPTDEEIEDYFNENQADYGGDRVQARHIFIRVPEGTADTDVQSYANEIERIQASFEAGGDFTQLALSNSDDVFVTSNEGNLGLFRHGQSRYDTAEDTSFSDAVFELEVGEHGIVSSPQGFHLVEVTDRQPTTFEDVKSRVETDLSNEVVDQRFDEWLASARAEETFPPTEEIKARHILFSLDQSASEETVQSVSRKVDRVIVELKDGADFAELANKYSEDPGNQSRQAGGDLGWFGHGRMVAEFDQAAFNLEINEISEPVRTSHGIHIIQVTDRRETDTVKTNIMRSYSAEAERRQYQEWLEEQRETAEIEVMDPLLRAFGFEEEARLAEDPETKLSLYDQALQAYETAKSDISISDSYIGYYQSEVHRLRLDVLEGQLEELGENASEEEITSLEAQIEQARQMLSARFLESASAYAEVDSQLFERTVAEDRDNPELRFQYGLYIYSFRNDPDAAFEQLQEVINLDPEHWQAMDWSARIEMERENYGSAVSFLEQAIMLSGEDSQTELLELRLAQALLEDAKVTGNNATLTRAEEILLELIAQFDPDNRSFATAQESLGDVYYEQDRFEDAIAAYDEALDAGPEAPNQVQVKLGNAELGAGQVDAAEGTLEDVVLNDAYSVNARVSLGDVYIAQDRTEEALTIYREAISLPSDALGRPVDPEVRIDIANKILDLRPEDVETKFTLAQIYMDELMPSRAIEIYQEILVEDPTSWEAQMGLGEAYQNRGEYSTALEFFQSALQNNPPSGEQISINNQIIEVDEILQGNNPLSEIGQTAILNLAQIYTDADEEIEAREQLSLLQEEYPEFQPDRVADMIDFLNTSRPGQYVESQGRQHISTGQSHEPYETTPPTSGPHIGNNIAPYGISATQIPDELQIHNLEHGAIIIQYQQGLDQPVVDQLTDYVNQLRRETEYCKLILAPYADLENPISLTAWTRVLHLDTFEEEPIKEFIDEYINQGPEQINDCQL